MPGGPQLLGDGSNGRVDHMLADGEMIKSVQLAPPLANERALYRRAISRSLAVTDPPGFALAQHLLVWATLPLAAFHASIVWAAAVRSPVAWAHVRYTIRRGRVVAASRS